MITGNARHFLLDKFAVSKKALHYSAEKTDLVFFTSKRFDWAFIKFLVEVRDHSAFNRRD